MSAHRLLVIAVVIVAMGHAPRGQTQLGVAGAPPAPATIRGRVVDERSGAPIPRAVVMVRNPSRAESVQLVANDDGEFTSTPLPPGRYEVTASPAEHRATHVASRLQRRDALELAAGTTREVILALSPALSISGRMVDGAGVPLAGLNVQLRDAEAGDATFGYRRTNDLGEFRIFNLAAGRYTVCAEPPHSPRIQEEAPPPDADPPRAYVRTCSSPVTLGDSPVEGVEVRVPRQPTFAVSGTVLRASGEHVQAVNLGITRLFRNSAAGSSTSVAGGPFRIANLVAGDYVVTAVVRNGSGPRDLVEAARVSLRVDADVEGIVLQMEAPVTVRGRVIFEDVPPALRRDNLRVRVETNERSGPMGGEPASPATVAEDGTFEHGGVLFPSTVQVTGVPPGVAIRAVRYKGRDILDIPTRFDGDPRQTVEVTLTGRVGTLTGRVIADSGTLAPQARVVLFPADPARWTIPERGTATAGKDGSFTIRDVAPGDYYVAAIPAASYRALLDVRGPRESLLSRLVPVSERVTMLEHDRRSIDLTLKTPVEDHDR